jgi:hypothetical protein
MPKSKDKGKPREKKTPNKTGGKKNLPAPKSY